MDPQVTVVIPCHNHVRWIMDAINSVAEQDYEKKRIVVVDDGSTDGSYARVFANLDQVQTPKKKDDLASCTGVVSGTTKLLLCRLPTPHGPSFARNLGIKIAWADTDLFMFLDSDDIFLAGKLSRSVSKWAEAPDDIGVVYTDYDTFNPDTGLKIRQYKEPFSRERLMSECLPNMDSLISKKAFEQCGVLDESMRCCEDYDLWHRISEKFMITHIPEPLLQLRVGSHSSTSTVSQEVWEKNYRRVFEKAQERLSVS